MNFKTPKHQNTKLLFKFLIVLIFVFNYSCQKEETFSENDNSQQLIEYVDVQLALDDIFNNSTDSRNENSYIQNINFDKKATKFNSEKHTAYTFALINANIVARGNDFQYTTENLSITINGDGTYISHIFRYIPNMTWFNNPNSTIGNYSGQIQLLSLDREVLNDFSLVNGEHVLNNSSNRNAVMRDSGFCTTTVIEYLVCSPNPLVEDCYYEYSVNVSCSNGGSPSEENPCGNNGTEPCNDENPNNGGGGSGSVITNPILDSCQETNTCIDSNQTILNCTGPNPVLSQLDNEQKAVIANFIDNNGCRDGNREFIELAIEALADGECVFLFTIDDINNNSLFTQNLFADYTYELQQNHDLIKQQYLNIKNTDGKLASINYLIDAYSMNTFGPNSVTFNYTINFQDNISEGEAVTVSSYDTSGNMISCNIIIDNNLFNFSDFGFITRVIKHEIYHVLQNEVYGQNGLSEAAKEFDAYYAQIFRFNDLKRIGDLSIYNQLAKYMDNNMDQMSDSERSERQDMIDNAIRVFPKICNND